MPLTGRPFKFKPEEFNKKVDKYFAMCDEKGKPYTISGLCVFLGTNRETLRQYEQNETFSETVKIAKQKVENYVEEYSLLGKLNPAVSIFNLKNNFGWKDKQEIGLETKEIPTLNIKISDNTDLEKEMYKDEN